MRQGCNYIHICGASISSWARSCSVYRYGCMCGKIRHQVIFINNILQNFSNKINLPDGCVAERMADYTDNTGGPARAVWETWTVSEASWAWVGLWRVAERMRNKGKYKKKRRQRVFLHIGWKCCVWWLFAIEFFIISDQWKFHRFDLSF